MSSSTSTVAPVPDATELEAALRAMAAGRFVVLADDRVDPPRGALAVAAEATSADAVNVLASEARGVVCVGLSGARLDVLGIGLLPRSDPDAVAFTVSVEAAEGVSTGISTADRARTVAVLIDPTATLADLVSPGHIFPIRVHPGGVLANAGFAEAACDLTRLAGVASGAAVFAEVLGPDGEVATASELDALATRLGAPLIPTSALVRHRMARECHVRRLESGRVPTRFGDLDVTVWENLLDGEQHLLLQHGTLAPPADQPAPLVRLHSQCLTGDVFHSLRCDCGPQLDAAMARILAEPNGALLYLRQEGRGIGLVSKLRAYALQDRGRDTVEANEELGFKADARDYGIGAQILTQAGVHRVRILTNNPRKVSGLAAFGIQVEGREALQTTPVPENTRYLQAKKHKLGHLLDGV